MDRISTNNSKMQERDRRRSTNGYGSMSFGKVPPQAKEMEMAVLGAILLEREAYDLAAEVLSVATFYTSAHQTIFKSMQILAQKNMPIDLLTVVEELRVTEKLDEVGGPYYVSRLTNGVVSGANIETHCRIILQKFIQRELIRIGIEMVSEGYEESTDVFDQLDKAETGLYSLVQNHIKGDYKSYDAGYVELMKHMEDLRKLDDFITGVPTGYEELDKITHGWQPTDLIILAARPSVGKTAFALNLAKNAAMHAVKPTPVGIFSMEMSRRQLMARLVSMQTGIWLERFSTGRITDEQMDMMYKKQSVKCPIFIDDTAAINTFELRAKCRRMVKKNKVGLIIIDYLQLMEANSNNKNGNREQEISKISRDLKKLAKDIQVPIIALSQLSREVEKRGKGQKVPQLSDLRESGAIEQDADAVIFLYRPPEDEVAEDSELKGKAMAKIAKNRNGSLESFAFQANDSIQRWDEIGILNGQPKNVGPNSNLIPINSLPIKSFYEPKNDDDLPF